MHIYAMNPYRLTAIGLIMLLIYTAALYYSNKWKAARNAFRIINALLAMIAVYGILRYSVLNRDPSSNHVFAWAAEHNDEFYRELFMNALLYYPLGLALSVFAGPWSILAGFLLSMAVEIWQYCAGTGFAQGTDVIMNTLGCAIGALPYIIVKILTAGKKKKQ